MVTGKTELLRAQRRWADAHGVHYDARGFVRALADNLRVRPDETVLAELRRGSELEPRATQPARAHSLCSSAALVVIRGGAKQQLEVTLGARQSA